jgi:hypothetical protein
MMETPQPTSARTKSTRPVLSETEINADVMGIKEFSAITYQKNEKQKG